MIPMAPPKRLVIHHSASPRETTYEQVEGWHLEKGWDAIGYHYLIDGEAKAHVGRPIVYQGAHAKGANRDSIGICVTGDNTRDGLWWDRVQKLELTLLVGALRRAFPGIEVMGHREVPGAATLCPGVDVSWLRDA